MNPNRVMIFSTLAALRRKIRIIALSTFLSLLARLTWLAMFLVLGRAALAEFELKIALRALVPLEWELSEIDRSVAPARKTSQRGPYPQS